MRQERIPSAKLPHLSRLYSAYLNDFASVSKYYARSPFPVSTLRYAGDYPAERRKAVANILEKQNRGWGASAKTMENIGRLRNGAAAIVTGQQAGLFGGPLLSLLKALSAIKVAQKLTENGEETVPIFWVATEDHDLAEVASTNLIALAGNPQRITAHPQNFEGKSVGEVVFGAEIENALKEIKTAAGGDEILALLRDSYQPKARFGDAFARLFAKLFADFGLILIDNAHEELHRIAAPVYENAARGAAELNKSLQARTKELEKDGFAAQVKVSAAHTLLFCRKNGIRTLVTRAGDHYFIGDLKLSQRELEENVAKNPQDLTPNALLRPVIQDYLLPTTAYIGGPAEIAYFAQSAVVYEKLLGRVTPVLPRF